MGVLEPGHKGPPAPATGGVRHTAGGQARVRWQGGGEGWGNREGFAVRTHASGRGANVCRGLASVLAPTTGSPGVQARISPEDGKGICLQQP